jgi:hypothetical protein
LVETGFEEAAAQAVTSGHQGMFRRAEACEVLCSAVATPPRAASKRYSFKRSGMRIPERFVTGDTAGYPYKDTARPAVNQMITNIVALLLLAILARS